MAPILELFNKILALEPKNNLDTLSTTNLSRKRESSFRAFSASKVVPSLGSVLFRSKKRLRRAACIRRRHTHTHMSLLKPSSSRQPTSLCYAATKALYNPQKAETGPSRIEAKPLGQENFFLLDFSPFFNYYIPYIESFTN